MTPQKNTTLPRPPAGLFFAHGRFSGKIPPYIFSLPIRCFFPPYTCNHFSDNSFPALAPRLHLLALLCSYILSCSVFLCLVSPFLPVRLFCIHGLPLLKKN